MNKKQKIQFYKQQVESAKMMKEGAKLLIHNAKRLESEAQKALDQLGVDLEPTRKPKFSLSDETKFKLRANLTK
ncbi:hypothetical protein JJC03_09375 [Flavobacterium oreochromis]|uniref:hypothetical protein n=1 Tax=Flavobacterium oreochromis TaxID=2906078 RepID=UPI001CE63BCE|nr:hypothetical protein [Flavobacterium oreochromis]QYS85448.1 hypothetical protein JJC03_09375 [Flavobacterium oreochromis]